VRNAAQPSLSLISLGSAQPRQKQSPESLPPAKSNPFNRHAEPRQASGGAATPRVAQHDG